MFAQISAMLLRPAATAALRGASPLARAACPLPRGFSSAAATPTLLARLGGEPALRATLDKFYSTLVIDPDVERFFVRTEMAKLKKHQVRGFLNARLSAYRRLAQLPRRITTAASQICASAGSNAPPQPLPALLGAGRVLCSTLVACRAPPALPPAPPRAADARSCPCAVRLP
jgi:hypothetical protein